MTSNSRRVYFVCCPYYITDSEFDDRFAYPIRYAGAKYPDCKFIIVGDRRGAAAGDFLRKIGVCPTRVTVYCAAETANPHGYVVKRFTDARQMYVAATNNSTHDIAWTRDDDTESFAYQCKERRKVYLKINPYV